MFCYLPGERSLTTSHPDYVPSIFPKSPKTPTKASVKTLTKASAKTSVESPHRQKLSRFNRRLSMQSKKTKGGFGLGLCLPNF